MKFFRKSSLFLRSFLENVAQTLKLKSNFLKFASFTTKCLSLLLLLSTTSAMLCSIIMMSTFYQKSDKLSDFLSQRIIGNVSLELFDQLTAHSMTPLGWLGHKTSTQTIDQFLFKGDNYNEMSNICSTHYSEQDYYCIINWNFLWFQRRVFSMGVVKAAPQQFSSEMISSRSCWRWTLFLIYKYCIYPKYWDTLSTYHTCPKIWKVHSSTHWCI